MSWQTYLRVAHSDQGEPILCIGLGQNADVAFCQTIPEFQLHGACLIRQHHLDSTMTLLQLTCSLPHTKLPNSGPKPSATYPTSLWSCNQGTDTIGFSNSSHCYSSKWMKKDHVSLDLDQATRLRSMHGCHIGNISHRTLSWNSRRRAAALHGWHHRRGHDSSSATLPCSWMKWIWSGKRCIWDDCRKDISMDPIPNYHPPLG